MNVGPVPPVATRRRSVTVRSTATMHSTAWMAWVTMVMVVALTTTNPLYLVLVLLSIVLVAVVAPKNGVGTASLRAMALFGIIMVALSVFVATINGNYGDHIMFTMPGPQIPSWLGGLKLGGPVTAEAFIGSLVRSLAAFCVFMGFAVYSASVSVQRVVRATPAALFHLGLIVTIGLTLLPASIEDLRRIREMQALRGTPPRLRALPGLVVPAIIGGLERAMRLAEAMEARGVASADARPSTSSRLLSLLPAPLILVALWLWFYAPGWRLLAGGCFLAAGFTLVLWARTLSRASKRTRLHDEPIPAGDRIVIAASIAVASIAFVSRQLDLFALNYNPFLNFGWPTFSAAGALLAMAVALPAIRILLMSDTKDPVQAIIEEAEPVWS